MRTGSVSVLASIVLLSTVVSINVAAAGGSVHHNNYGGENGQNGQNGYNGQNGANGSSGANGHNGYNGQDGANGSNGANGQNGTNGENGLNGDNGQNGENGASGENGQNGQNGHDGRDGRSAASTAFAAPVIATEDTCMGSSSVGAQGMAFGLSLGTTWRDRNCQRLKNARELSTMGYDTAAVALLCVDVDVQRAMRRAGTPCPGSAVAPANNAPSN